MGIMSSIKGQDIGGAVKVLKSMAQDIEDMRTVINQSIDAMTSIYANQLAIAKHFNIELPEPVIDMGISDEEVKTEVE